MPRRNVIPSYRLHRSSGHAVVTLPDGLGGRKDVLLGKWGSPESRAEYVRVLAEWEANGRRLPPPQATTPDISIHELILAYHRHVEQNYRQPDGSPSRHLENVKDALRPLKELYGHTTARVFGPRALKTVQQHMIGQGLARNTVNKRLGRLKTLFRWAESEELIPPATRHALDTVAGLRRGRTEARETAPIRPVAPEVVAATLPHLLPVVADMVRLQQLTGMRSGELVLMRTADLDVSGPLWTYRPEKHKTAHHGHQRAILIGPRGQEIVRKYLNTELHAFLFSPQKAREQWEADKRQRRKSKVQPSQRDRRKAKPKRHPGERYEVGSYAYAIRRGVVKANRARLCPACQSKPRGEALCADCRPKQLPHWHPHQLRHAKATEIRREAGLDAARAVLGHRSPQITEVYAEIDLNKAAEVMARLG